MGDVGRGGVVRGVVGNSGAGRDEAWLVLWCNKVRCVFI